MARASRRRLASLLLGALLATTGGREGVAVEGRSGQAAPQRPTAPRRGYGTVPAPTAPSRVEKLGSGTLKIGFVMVDLAKREVAVLARINDVPAFEFLVNTRDGYKSYESLIEANTNAIDFNLGLILIGLDRDRATRRPRFHFDPIPPEGDTVEMWVSWGAGAGERRVKADELMWNDATRTVVPHSRWVYTGSAFLRGSTAFLADQDGVLVGFAHTPAPLIERVDAVPQPYGVVRLNPSLGLKPGSFVKFSVRVP